MSNSGVKELTRTEDITKTPKMSNVYLINDDFTTFDHVVYILNTIFSKSTIEAEKITMKIHYEGKALVGSYPKDVALTKVKKVKDLSRQKGYPLKAEIL